jgi:hypothetical protein
LIIPCVTRMQKCCRDATSVSSTWLTASEPVWLLGVWNLEADNDGSASPKRWRIFRGMIQASGVSWLWMTTKVFFWRDRKTNLGQD